MRGFLMNLNRKHKLLCVTVLALAHLGYALDLEQSIKIAQDKCRDKVFEIQYARILQENTHDYSVIVLQDYQDTQDQYGNVTSQDRSCVNVFIQGKIRTMSFSRSIEKIMTNKENFTLTTAYQDTAGNITRWYYTFAISQDTIFLKEYGKQDLYIGIDDVEETPNGEIMLYKSDTQNKQILLDSINDELLQGLENKSQYLPVIQQGQSQ